MARLERAPTSGWSLLTRKFDKPAQKGKQMAEAHSNTESFGLQCTSGAPFGDNEDWHAIPWQQVNANVRRLQARIVKAQKESRHNKVKALQHLLTRSFSGKAIAVRRVTENDGQKTYGVDKQRWD